MPLRAAEMGSGRSPDPPRIYGPLLDILLYFSEGPTFQEEPPPYDLPMCSVVQGKCPVHVDRLSRRGKKRSGSEHCRVESPEQVSPTGVGP